MGWDWGWRHRAGLEWGPGPWAGWTKPQEGVDRENKAYGCPQDPDKKTAADFHRPSPGLIPGFRAGPIVCATSTRPCAMWHSHLKPGSISLMFKWTGEGKQDCNIFWKLHNPKNKHEVQIKTNRNECKALSDKDEGSRPAGTVFVFKQIVKYSVSFEPSASIII